MAKTKAKTKTEAKPKSEKLVATLPIEHRPKDAKGPNATKRFEPGDTFDGDMVDDKTLKRLLSSLAVVPADAFKAMEKACEKRGRSLPDLIIILRRLREFDIDVLAAEFETPGPLTEKILQSPHAPEWRAFFG